MGIILSEDLQNGLNYHQIDNNFIYLQNLVNSISGSNCSGSIQTTRSNLITLINSSSLIPGVLYKIIDSSASGSIYVQSLSTSSVGINCIWERNTNLKSFGHIQISGSSGSVDTLTVNGVNIMTTSVSYTSSITQTAINVCTNINANSDVSGYRAIDITNGSIVIEANTASTSTNGYVVSGSATSLTFSNSLPLANGQTPTTLLLDINYNLSEDRITRCQDSLGNIITVRDTTNANVNQAYINFPFGSTKYTSNIINSIYFFDNFVYDNNSYVSWNTLVDAGARLNKNFIYTTGGGSCGIFYNNLLHSSILRNNCIILNSSLTTHQLSYNKLSYVSTIRDNYINLSPTISVSIAGNILDGSAIISSNISNGTNCQILQNTLMNGSSISNNTSTTTLYIYYNILNYSNGITSNTFSGSLTSVNGIIRNKLIGTQAGITGNTITATTTSNIKDNILLGNSATINNNTLAGANANIQNNVINGNSSGINSNTTISNSTIQNNVINASNSIITGITLSTDYLSFQNLTWNSDEYSFIFTTNTFNNTANRGLVNSPVTLGYIMPKVIPSNAFVDYGTMTSATSTAQIKIGIETDNDSNILSSTVITSLNGTMQEYSPIFIKPTVLRKIILTPTVEGLTGGQLRLSLKNKIGL